MAINPDDPEFRKAARLASAFTNRAYITIDSGVVRIAFGEAAGSVGESVFHSAVTLTIFDALRLADTIYSTYDEAYPPSPPPSPPPGQYPASMGGLLGQALSPPGTKSSG